MSRDIDLCGDCYYDWMYNKMPYECNGRHVGCPFKESAYGDGPQTLGCDGAEAPCQGRASNAREPRSGCLDMERPLKQAASSGQRLADDAIDCGLCGMPFYRCSCDFGV